MGADIHTYIDYQTRGPKNSIRVSYFGSINIQRDYILFGLMTNGRVRLSDAQGYTPDPKDLPEDMSDKLVDEVGRVEGHSYSWLSLKELNDVVDAYPIVSLSTWGERSEAGPEVLTARDILESLERDPNIEEARLVFWFDS